MTLAIHPDTPWPGFILRDPRGNVIRDGVLPLLFDTKEAAERYLDEEARQ